MIRKALIVEDEQPIALLLAEHLRGWGFTPTILSEGRPVAEWVLVHRPSLVLLDLMLPDIDGYAVCETLKLDRETNLIPIIMVTALCTSADRVRGLQVGANQYLTKPFSHQDLRRAIDDAF